MNNSKSDSGEAKASKGRRLWIDRAILRAMCILVLGVYTFTAHSGFVTESLSAASNYYNLLVQSFRAGQLSLNQELPPGFTQLVDPYDPTENAPFRSAPYRMLDTSYYKGKLYMYFGITPALMLFWPCIVLTGRYLSYGQAGVIFCAIGFLASVNLLRSLWQRYFAEAGIWMVAAGALALGLTTGVPVLLAQCDVYEVAVSCGYALTMIAVAAIWKALHESRKRSGWLATASLAYGLAVASRPSLLFGAIILLVPVIQAWRERQKIWAPLLTATVPILLIGLGLTFYNKLRFDDPWEFGWRYQLTGYRQLTAHRFSLQNLWFNFRIYFLERAHWHGRFPFLQEATLPPLPVGYARVESPFGVLTNIPLVWLALAVPLGWRNRSGPAQSILRWFVMVVVLLFGTCALMVGLFWSAIIRYEVEFLPALVLLAVCGILSLERALSNRPSWRCAARWVWGFLLAFSVAFNLFASVERCGEAHNSHGVALAHVGRLENAIGEYERALHLKPDYAEAHYNLGVALARTGRMQEAIEHWEQALRIKPDLAEAHNNLGVALMGLGQLQEAVGHYEEALRIKPDNAETHNNLGNALVKLERFPEAIGEYEQALRLRPDFAETHYNLGVALQRIGQLQEAIAQYKLALRFKPDYAEAQNALARLQERK